MILSMKYLKNVLKYNLEIIAKDWYNIMKVECKYEGNYYSRSKLKSFR